MSLDSQIPLISQLEKVVLFQAMLSTSTEWGGGKELCKKCLYAKESNIQISDIERAIMIS